MLLSISIRRCDPRTRDYSMWMAVTRTYCLAAELLQKCGTTQRRMATFAPEGWSGPPRRPTPRMIISISYSLRRQEQAFLTELRALISASSSNTTISFKPMQILWTRNVRAIIAHRRAYLSTPARIRRSINGCQLIWDDVQEGSVSHPPPAPPSLRYATGGTHAVTFQIYTNFW